MKTPTEVQAAMIADLEARLQLSEEARFYLMAERNRLAAQIEIMQRRAAP